MDIEAEALDLAEGAAKLAFGTRFKRVPRAILRKLSVPVVFVLGAIVVLCSTAMGVVNRWIGTPSRGAQRRNTHRQRYPRSRHVHLCCVYRDPGRVPVGWKPDAEAGGALLELKRKGGSRFCKKCQRHKPRGHTTVACVTGACYAWITIACGSTIAWAIETISPSFCSSCTSLPRASSALGIFVAHAMHNVSGTETPGTGNLGDGDVSRGRFASRTEDESWE